MPLAKIQKKYPFKLVLDKVIEIHAKENKVVCENHTLTYDYLVVAFGAEKLPGAEFVPPGVMAPAALSCGPPLVAKPACLLFVADRHLN